MSTDPEAATIFLQAQQLPAVERSEFLRTVCVDRETLRRHIEELLAADREAGGFLPDTPGGPATEMVTSQESSGAVIGRYKLLQKIGEGGMGTVWMAEQREPVVRRVALKIIKLGMDTHEVVARFEQERQALAMMDHAAIAKVLDAGATDSGRPYFVMELVRGVSVTNYCDEQKLGVPERLGIFMQICQAIQHAHQKGIIHRDIKPSNILVTAGDDGEPLPKVIDFGIAKATGAALTDKTLFTQLEQIIGTPAYMSPEQAGLGPLDIDTRSDVYALGVLLYELLTGRPPFDPRELMKAGLDEMRRVIREDEPPRPSTRISSLTAEELSGTATRRQMEPPKLASSLRGDLDWIVMKALEKNRNRRYETASGLAADIQRFLSDEPITARAPTAAYVFSRLIRRHKLAFAAGAAVLAALVLGITGTSWGLIRADKAKQLAEQKEKEAVASALAERKARDAAAESLWRSQVSQGRALLYSRGPGDRASALLAIRLAAAYRPSPELRTAAISCLADPVFEPAESWPADATREGIYSHAVDEKLTVRAAKNPAGDIIITSIADGREVAKLPNSTPWPTVSCHPVFSPDGLLLFAIEGSEKYGPQSGFTVWNWRHQRRLLTDDQVAGLIPPVLKTRWMPTANSAEFSPDSRFLAFLYGGDVVVIALEKPQVAHRRWKLPGTTCVRFSPDGTRLAVGGLRDADEKTYRGACRIYSMTGDEAGSIDDFAAYPRWLAWSPDGNELAFACDDNRIHIRAAGEPKRERLAIPTFSSDAITVSWSRNGEWLAAHNSGMLQLWHATTGELIANMESQSDGRSPGFLAGDSRLGPLRLEDRIVMLKLTQPGFRRHRQGWPPRNVGNVDSGPGGRILGSTSPEGVHLWNREARPVGFLALPDSRHLHFLPDALLVATGKEVSRWPILSPVDGPVIRFGPAGRIRTLGTDANEILRGFSGPRLISTRPKANPPGPPTLILVSDMAGKLPDLEFPPQEYNFGGFAASSDNRWLALSTGQMADLEVAIMDALSREVCIRLPKQANLGLNFSPDNRWLVTFGDSEYHFWKTDSWIESGRLPRRESHRENVIFNCTGSMFAVNQTTRSMDLHNADDLRKLATFETGDETPLIFSSDETQLITRDSEGHLHFWDLAGLRRELNKLGLDWEAPPLTPAEGEPVTKVDFQQ